MEFSIWNLLKISEHVLLHKSCRAVLCMFALDVNKVVGSSQPHVCTLACLCTLLHVCFMAGDLS